MQGQAICAAACLPATGGGVVHFGGVDTIVGVLSAFCNSLCCGQR